MRTDANVMVRVCTSGGSNVDDGCGAVRVSEGGMKNDEDSGGGEVDDGGGCKYEG